MLAKMWKKVLLAVCIIACLYNIMSKIISRTSLESNLDAVKGGKGIFVVENTTNTVNSSEKSNSSEEINNKSYYTVDDLQNKDESDFVVIY